LLSTNSHRTLASIEFDKIMGSLSYLAGGFKGVGLWSWNYRNAGWESGEYALLKSENTPCERAIRAGRITKAANKYRDEIWQAHKEPYVGVFVNWDNEAIWADVAGPTVPTLSTTLYRQG
jgi:beta-galactosidase